MKFSIYALLLSAVSAAAAPLDVIDEIAVEGPIAPLEWTGQVEVGGDTITLTGSAEEIYNQIIAINPNYDDELGVKDWKQMSRRAVSQVQKRGDPINTAASSIPPLLPKSLNCDVGSGADPLFVLTGIDYLYGIGNGGCGAPAGWGGCSRTSCSWGSAIYLCNDRTVPITVPCKHVADNAAGIHNNCKHWFYDPPAPRRTDGRYDYRTNGQIFSFDGTWNVIVRSDNC